MCLHDTDLVTILDLSFLKLYIGFDLTASLQLFSNFPLYAVYSLMLEFESVFTLIWYRTSEWDPELVKFPQSPHRIGWDGAPYVSPLLYFGEEFSSSLASVVNTIVDVYSKFKGLIFLTFDLICP